MFERFLILHLNDGKPVQFSSVRVLNEKQCSWMCVCCREESEMIEGEVVDVQIDRPTTVCSCSISCSRKHKPPTFVARARALDGRSWCGVLTACMHDV